mgnify:CR=1 FL=1
MLLRPFDHLPDGEMHAEDLWHYRRVGRQGHRAHRVSGDLRLPRVPLSPEAGDRRRVRLDLRPPRHVQLGRRDLEPDARSRHRQTTSTSTGSATIRSRTTSSSIAGATTSSVASRTSVEAVRSSAARAASRSAAGTAFTRSAIRRRSSSSARSRDSRSGSSGRRSPRRRWSSCRRLPKRSATITGAVRLVVQNTGWLPSYVSKRALERKVVPRRDRGDRVAGRREAACTASAAKSWDSSKARRTSTRACRSGRTTTSTDDRVKVEWIVQGKKGDEVRAHRARTSARAPSAPA